MNELIKQFDGVEIKTHLDKNGNVWFVASDVMSVLGIKHVGSALRKLQNSERDVLTNSDSSGRNQEMSIVNESGLYSLIFQSRKPNANKFRYWVTNEVLPSLRKTGEYAIRELDPLDILENHVKKMRALEKANADIANKLNEVSIEAKQQNDTLTSDQISMLDKEIVNRFKELGGKEFKLLSLMRKAIKDEFFEIKGTRTAKEIRRADFDKAIQIVRNFQPPSYLNTGH